MNSNDVLGSIARSVVVVAVVGGTATIGTSPRDGMCAVSLAGPESAGVTFGKSTEETVDAPLLPPGVNDVLLDTGGTVNLDGRDVDVRNTLGWLVINQGGTTGRCVLVVVNWLASTH